MLAIFTRNQNRVTMDHYHRKLTFEFDKGQSEEFLELLRALHIQVASPLEESNQEGFLNIDQTSQYLGIPKNTLYQYTSRRKIPFVKVGKQLIFEVAELKQWLKSLKKEVL